MMSNMESSGECYSSKRSGCIVACIQSTRIDGYPGRVNQGSANLILN